MQTYSYLKMARKAMGVFVAVMTAVLAIQLPSSVEFSDAWPGYLLAVIAAAIKAYTNYQKHHTNTGMFMKLIVVALLVPGMTVGCVATGFREIVTDETGVQTDTQYRAVSAAWPFSKIDSTLHSMDYRWGGSEEKQNEIAVGQNAQNIDNTGMAAIIPVIELLVKALTAQYATPATPTVAP